MGSWSENCGFSGLEISESDDAYVMLLKGPRFSESHGPYTMFQPLTVPLRGHYGDYGYLAVDDDPEILQLFNEQSGLQLAMNDDFALEHLDGQKDVYRFWIHADIMDQLELLEPDYPYIYDGGKNIEVKTLGEQVDVWLAGKTTKVEAAMLRNAKLRESPDADPLSMALELTLLQLDLGSTGRTPVEQFYGGKIQDLVMGKSNLDLIKLSLARRRNGILERAADELRKKIVPSEAGGPQHGGHVASAQFAWMIINTQAKRRVDEEDEG